MADKLGIYIHIPFCRSKCDYCDFYSLAGRDDRMDQYQKALLSHIKETAPLAQDFPVDTIYIGGGTPSYYGAKRLKELLGVIRKLYKVEKDAEVTVECNPDSVDVKSLKILRKAGVNRLSMGMQSANACELERIHRIHTPQQVNEAATAARKAGFTNLSLDLIYGLPGQTMDSWKATVEHALSLIPQHLSCYGLKVEEGTPLAARVAQGEILPDDDQQADLYLWTVGRLERAGYPQYEISNFAKPGFASRHNLRYWLTQPYIGFGPGAHSDFGGRRYSFVRDLDAYIQGVLQGGDIIDESEIIPKRASTSRSTAAPISWTSLLSRPGWSNSALRAGRSRPTGVGISPQKASCCPTSLSATCWNGRSRRTGRIWFPDPAMIISTKAVLDFSMLLTFCTILCPRCKIHCLLDILMV